jgi:Sap, sulfolipid-1-addressing protein
VAISPVPIIAVILMLFSKRARVNGPMFGIGWAVALAVVSGVACFIADAVVSLIAFVVVGSLTIAGPVLYYLLAGDRAKTQLDSAKGWLAVHNDAVMTVLFLVFGVNLIAKGIPPLT